MSTTAMFTAVTETRQRRRTVAEFLQGLIETHTTPDERRGDERIEIALAVAVIPCVDGQPDLDRAFPTITRDVSRDGVSLIVNRRFDEDQVVVGFSGTSITFVRAEVIYRESQVMGCWRLGLRMTEVVEVESHAGLERFFLS